MKKKTLLLAGLCTLTLCSCGGGNTPEPTPIETFTVTFNSNGGTQIASQIVAKGNKIVKPDNPTKVGYSFNEWTYKGEVWSFIGYVVTEDMTLDAKYLPINFPIVYHLDGGINNPENITEFNIETDTFTLLDPTKAGYNFIGWYSDPAFQNKITQITKGSCDQKDVYAKWSDPIIYNISYELNGGTNNPSNPSTYTVEDTIIFANPTKADYSFVNWTKEGSPITGISKGTIGNITIDANWNINQYQVNVYTNDKNKGTVTGGGSFDYGSSVTVTATPVGENIFNGWYSDSEHKILLSNKNSYEITVPSGGTSLYAKFLTKEEEETWNKNHGVIPVISEDGKTLTYGSYPQTHVNDNALIAELEKVAPATDEEYFWYDGDYYIKDTGNPCDPSYTFSDGATVVSGATYFFKCEPIKWNIKGTGTNYTIDCSNILYAHRFAGMYNNYANSELRAWLNGDFYNKAFSIKSTNSYIVPTDLSDVEVTGDKVWVGSYDQYNFTGWYYEDEERQKKLTDFAICNYTYMNTTTAVGCGYYWTHTPIVDDKSGVRYVQSKGGIGGGDVNFPDCGISPCLTIKK